MAKEAGLPIGGYCPKGELAEDGAIPDSYSMTELESLLSYQGTQKNVVESDGTLILNKGELTDGTLLTKAFTTKHGKPCLIVQLDARKIVKQDQVLGWLAEQQIKTLNIAGPRESKYPGGIYAESLSYLQELFAQSKDWSYPT